MLITGITQKIEAWVAETELPFRLVEGYYLDVIEKEIILANITKNDHILCIGGGICPFSAILFYRATGAKVTVIDNNRVCISKARDVIKRLRLNENVYVLHQDGTSVSLPFSDYSIVHFAVQVYPMNDVFSHVESRVAPGTKLLVRRPKRRLNRLYGCFPGPMLHLCPFTTHKKARNIGSTLLYIKPEVSIYNARIC